MKRTKAIESSSNPTWTHNNCFHFPIKEGEALAGLIHGKVYAENTLFGDTLVGELEIAMDELNLDTKVVNWFQLRSYGTTAPLLDVRFLKFRFRHWVFCLIGLLFFKGSEVGDRT